MVRKWRIVFMVRKWRIVCLNYIIAYWRLPCSKIFKKSLNQGISRLWSKTPRFVQCVPESAIEQTGSTFAQLLLNRRWFSWELRFLNRSKTLNRPTSRITAEHLSGPQAGTCQSPAQFHLCRNLITVIKYSQQACVSVSGRRRCKITLYSFYATSIKIFTTAQYDMSHAHSVGKTSCVCVFKRRARSARTEGANAFSLGITLHCNHYSYSWEAFFPLESSLLIPFRGAKKIIVGTLRPNMSTAQAQQVFKWPKYTCNKSPNRVIWALCITNPATNKRGGLHRTEWNRTVQNRTEPNCSTVSLPVQPNQLCLSLGSC